MRLSFTTRGFPEFDFERALDHCADAKMQGVELRAADETPNARRALLTQGLSVPCVTLALTPEQAFARPDELMRAMRFARRVSCPCVSLEAPMESESDERVIECLKPLVRMAVEEEVTLLLPSRGAYADTKRLRHVLGAFALDELMALWDTDAPFRDRGESPEETIDNLGAYIRHVHLRDAITENGRVRAVLTGDGDSPVGDALRALRAINYGGFISLDWTEGELNDPEILLPHFAHFMSRRDLSARRRAHLPWNRARTGRYVFEKDALIEMTFSQLLDRVVREFPDQRAFRFTTLDYTRTYEEFREDVDDFARALIALNVRSGDKVAVWATNVPQWYIAFWAAVKIGAVLVTVNTAYKIHEAEYLLRQSDTRLLILEKGFRDSDYESILLELCPEMLSSDADKPLRAARLPFLRRVVTVGFQMPGALSFDQAVSEYAPRVPREELRRRAAAVDPYSVCNMQYTSGTTGFPKGVMLTHHNIINNGKCIGDRMDLSTADRMMIQVPMFHCFGMVLAMTASMTHGATLLPLPYFSAKPALSCIHQERVTCFHGVPTMFIAMLQHPDFEKTDFSSMRTGIMAGSPCPIAVMRDVVEKMRMTEITIVYGQTEAAPGCTMSSAEDSIEVRVGTVGRPLPGVECKIVDPETGEELPDDVTGEFVARGYNIMRGYYKMPRATASAIDLDGWLHTGDLALRTKEGNYRITGRLKDMIIRGGENIYPKEIEEFLYTFPKIRDVQVIGVPSRELGEEICACVILKEGETSSQEEIQAYVREHMARHKTPKYVLFMEEFPMNVAGKILKYKMREDAAKALSLSAPEETA